MIINSQSLDLVEKGFKTVYTEAFLEADTNWDKVAMTVPSSGRDETYGWMGQFPQFREWIGPRHVNGLEAHSFTIVNKDFESTVAVPRNHILDDRLGVFKPAFSQMGYLARQHPEELIMGLLANGFSTTCYDGQNYFDTDHPVAANHDGTGATTNVANYDDNGGDTTPPAWYLLDTRDAIRPFIFQERTQPEIEAKENPAQSDHVFIKDQYLYGTRYRCNAGFGFWQKAFKSHAPLTAANYEATKTAMMGFQGDGGKPLGIMPNVLVVPTALWADANRLINIMFDSGGGSNPYYQDVTVLTVPWLGG